MKRAKLIKWQKENGYLSKFVAEKLEISEATYSLIKKGETRPTIDLLYKFNEKFNPDGKLNLLELFRKEE